MQTVKKTVNLFICLLLASFSFGQNVEIRLANAIKALEGDEQFKHAILSMYLVESKTGKVIYDKNSQVGLAPASCLKVVTSTSAFELLGKDFRYKTSIYLDTTNDHFRRSGKYQGILILRGSGDPTLGSWRYASTADTVVLNKWAAAIKTLGIPTLNGTIISEDVEKPGDMNSLPDGYIWQDIGNYYATTASLLNWRENQYDIKFRSEGTGKKTEIISTYPPMPRLYFNNAVIAGEAGSGDNAYIYCAPYADTAYIRGTIPPGKNEFTISGSMPNPILVLDSVFQDAMERARIGYFMPPVPSTSLSNWKYGTEYDKRAFELKGSEQYSPSLDSINYWFLKRSVNLYGEAFVKTIGRQKANSFSTDAGLEVIKKFWKTRGIEPSALNIIDGSGLSPANRVTTNALVTIMQYAKQQSWFPSFYDALPELNNIKMKDGYINGVRSFTGYVTSKSGAEYTFSLIVNNFDGSAGTVREKMWKLLDILK